MKCWPTKELGKALTGVIFVGFAVCFFIKTKYLYSIFLLFLVLVLFKLEDLTEIIFSSKGSFSAKFKTPREKIEENIKENNKPVTKRNFIHFQRIEQRILTDIHKKLGGEMKTLIHYAYGFPGKTQFMYTPDATIQTKNEIIFLEVKYIIKAEFAPKIVESTVKYLKTILDKFGPPVGKKLVAKLVLASSYDLDLKSFKIPEGIELDFYKL